MLKARLEENLDRVQQDLKTSLAENSKLGREVNEKNEQIQVMQGEIDRMQNQLKQISQSVYTMLRINYPDNEEVNHSRGDETQDERFLKMIHELCDDRTTRVNTAADLFRHMSR